MPPTFTRSALRGVSAAIAFAALVPTPALAQKAGGTLRAYIWESPPTASPLEETTISTVQPFQGVFNNLLLFDQHIARNSQDTIRPELATVWSWNEDRTRLTMTLREGVKWHDGKPFTSADVKCTWDTITGKRDAGWRKNPRKEWYGNLKEVLTNGDGEVTFVLGRPQTSFLSFLAAGHSPVYPCHVPGREMRQKPIGTGPFKVVDFKPNDGVTLARNPDYWKPGRPYLDGMEWRVVKNRATRVLGFVAREFDMTFAQDVTVPILRDIKAQVPDAHCEMNPIDSQGQLLINRTAPPFDNAELRRAMALSLDRKAFIDILSEGVFTVGGALQAPPAGNWGLTPAQLADLPGYSADVAGRREEARGIMRGLGYGPDKPLKVKVSARNTGVYRDAAIILIDQLKQIHIEGELEMVETAVWYTKMERRNFTLAYNGNGFPIDDPDLVLFDNYTCESERNYSGYCNRTVQAKFDEQSAMADQEKRRTLVQEIDRTLQQDGAVPILYQLSAAICLQPYLKGVTLLQNSQYNNWRMEDAWLDK